MILWCIPHLKRITFVTCGWCWKGCGNISSLQSWANASSTQLKLISLGLLFHLRVSQWKRTVFGLLKTSLNLKILVTSWYSWASRISIADLLKGTLKSRHPCLRWLRAALSRRNPVILDRNPVIRILNHFNLPLRRFFESRKQLQARCSE
jgi:hypothetical protein